MNKELHKAIMKRTRLRNKFWKNKNENNWQNYKVQRNLCKKLLRSTKKAYFRNLYQRKIVDNRAFWKTVCPFFKEKTSKGENIILLEDGKNVLNEKELCKIFKDFFGSVVKDLKIPSVKGQGLNFSTSFPIINEFTREFELHTSISIVRKKNITTSFTFSNVNQTEVMKIINDLDITKTCQSNDTPTKVAKYNDNIYASYICSHFNMCLEKGEFPEILKDADIIPIHKKKRSV